MELNKHIVCTWIPRLCVHTHFTVILVLTDQSPKLHCPRSMDLFMGNLTLWDNYISVCFDLSLTFPLMWPDCPGVSPLMGPVQKAPMRQWLYWNQLNMIVFVDCVCRGWGWGYHIMQALGLVGRFIVWGWVWSTVDDVHTLWSVVWIQSNAEWMGSDMPKGFAIVCPLFIVYLMVPLMVDMCRNSVGGWKCWNSNVIFMWDKRTHKWN